MPIYFLLTVLYLLAGRWCVQRPLPARRFAALNLFTFAVVAYFTYHDLLKRHLSLNILIALALAAIYFAAMAAHYRLLKAKRWRAAFWLPVAVLVALKVVSLLAGDGMGAAVWFENRVLLIGVSYLTFKLSYSAVEIKNRRIQLPDFHTYIAYALYVPTLFVGPINPVSVQVGTKLPVPGGRAMRPFLWRLMLGVLKMTVLAVLVQRVGYETLVVKSAPVAMPIDYVIGMVANYLFIYLNFAGACDIVIAGSALLGIHVKENFNRPLIARSVQDFWTRWHMTLSMYFKEIVFTPFNMWLIGKAGRKYVNHCIAVSIMLVFVLIGLWHGTGMNFILFGVLHGLAVVTNHYYGIGMKSLLGKRYKSFYHHPAVRGAAMALTFAFISITMLLVNCDVAGFMSAVHFMTGGSYGY